MKLFCISIVISIFILEGFCIEQNRNILQSKSLLKNGDYVFRSLILKDLQEKPRYQRNQVPGGGTGFNLVPDILCFYARYGRWPSYPVYLRSSVIWMGRMIFAMNDDGVRAFCRQFNYFTGFDRTNIGSNSGPRRVTTRRQIPTRRRTTTPYYPTDYYSEVATDYPTDYGDGDSQPSASGSATGENSGSGQSSGRE